MQRENDNDSKVVQMQRENDNDSKVVQVPREVHNLYRCRGSAKHTSRSETAVCSLGAQLTR